LCQLAGGDYCLSWVFPPKGCLAITKLLPWRQEVMTRKEIF
jgi:hypothetical protein